MQLGTATGCDSWPLVRPLSSDRVKQGGGSDTRLKCQSRATGDCWRRHTPTAVSDLWDSLLGKTGMNSKRALLAALLKLGHRLTQVHNATTGSR